MYLVFYFNRKITNWLVDENLDSWNIVDWIDKLYWTICVETLITNTIYVVVQLLWNLCYGNSNVQLLYTV